jgi:hypothetical protein
VGHILWGELGLLGLLAMALLSLLFLLSPAVLEAGIGHGESVETWPQEDWAEHPSASGS